MNDQNMDFRPEDEKQKKRRSDLMFLMVCAGIVLLCITCKLTLNPVLVSGTSMEPTYHNMQILTSTVVKSDTEIGRKDVIAFRNTETENKVFIKRVEGIPGDTVYIHDGELYINNEEIEEGFDAISEAGIAKTPIRLGENEYFVLGDNRNNSRDSRFIGLIQKSEIKYLINR